MIPVPMLRIHRCWMRSSFARLDRAAPCQTREAYSMVWLEETGGGRRRTVAKQQLGKFRSKMNYCTNMKVSETESTCGAIKC